MIRALAAVAVCALAAATGSVAGRSPGPTVVADCLGKPQVEPTQIVLACGDGNESVGGITWTGWGSRFAAGLGTAVINDCTPSCVAGRDHSYPVVVVLSGHQTCRPGGQIAYERLTMAFLDSKPHTTASETFPCRPFR